HLLHVGAWTGGVEGPRRGDFRLGLAFPFLGHAHALFELSHAREILVESVAIARADSALERFGLVGDGVENALAQFDPAFLSFDFRFGALNEEALEDIRCLLFARNEHT